MCYTEDQKIMAVYNATKSQKKTGEVMGISTYKVSQCTQRNGKHRGMESNTKMYDMNGKSYDPANNEVKIPICPLEFF